MPCLTAAQKTDLETRKETLVAQLALANTAYTESLTSGSVTSYRFDPGDATQQATRRAPAELLQQIKDIQAEIDRINNRLFGIGLVSMRLRR